MGSELVSPASPISFTKEFERLCPFYLSIGMTYDEYWNESADRVIYYRKAYKMQQRRNNDLAWLNGRYIYDALTSVVPALKAFSKDAPNPYLTEPYPFSKEDCEERQKREMEERANRFRQYVNARNSELKARQEVEKDVDNHRPIAD